MPDRKPLSNSLSEKLKQLRLNSQSVAWKLRPEVLLSGQIPKPMHSVAPRIVLGQAWWNKVRKEAYEATEFHCVACGIAKRHAKYHRWLEGHELYKIDYSAGRMTYLECCALCYSCHTFIHSGRMQALLDRCEMSPEKFRDIITHGERVLRLVKLELPIPYNGPCAHWTTWRLIVEGKEYKPKFESFEAWESHWSKDK